MPLQINPTIANLCCSRSGRKIPKSALDSPVGLCSCCPPPGKPVIVEYDLGIVARELARAPLSQRSDPGIWRFSPLLPVIDVPAAYGADVGLTPIQHHARLSEELGVEVHVKNEGTNPSGSFKDRGLAVAVALGAMCGAKRFCLPTQGNAGVAACLFSARLGLPGCIIYMPDGFQGSVYRRACEHFGGEVRFAGPNIATAGRQMRTDLKDGMASGELVELSTFFEPGRLEGKKTMGLEITEWFGADALPDVIIYPTGGGTGLVGIWKALQELRQLGLLPATASLPRMVAVQSDRCAPVVRAFERGLEEVEPVESHGTVADGLDVPAAIMGHAMLAVLRESAGTAAAVSEEAIVAAYQHYGKLGINGGYESAATLAALQDLRSRREVAEGSRVLLLNTGSQLIPLGSSRQA